MSNYDEARMVCIHLNQAGFTTMFAGGCVRDRLFGLLPKDYDLATAAKPDQAQTILKTAGYHILPIGLQYGTIGVVTPSQTIEITTLRVDISCNGRHPEVGYTTDFAADAKRRDLTINGIFEDVDGRIHDFVGGYADLLKRRLRFIGDPQTRIREDYLRILRYIRFIARLGWPACPLAIKAIAAEKSGLGKLAMERILREWDQILTLTNTNRALCLADDSGCLQTLFSWYHTRGLTSLQTTLGKLRTQNSNLAWFFLLWHCGPQTKGPWLKREVRKLRFSRKRQLIIHAVFDLFTNPTQPFLCMTAIMRIVENQLIELKELKSLMECSSEMWEQSLFSQFQLLIAGLAGTQPELLRKDILSLPERERSEAILIAKIFWYLGWCGGKTQLRTVLLRAIEFRPWLEKPTTEPPIIDGWGDS